jgi:hypothetical protein
MAQSDHGLLPGSSRFLVNDLLRRVFTLPSGRPWSEQTSAAGGRVAVVAAGALDLLDRGIPSLGAALVTPVLSSTSMASHQVLMVVQSRSVSGKSAASTQTPRRILLVGLGQEVAGQERPEPFFDPRGGTEFVGSVPCRV